jgi:quercetin dioxygenase-like cupin family protein
MANYTYTADLLEHHAVPESGILSRTIRNDDQVKTVFFGFAAGEELSEHTASMPANLYFIQGDADLVLGEDPLEAHAGTWVHMDANLSHTIRAKTPVAMILTLIKPPKRDE